jgi:hypothetical protein
VSITPSNPATPDAAGGPDAAGETVRIRAKRSAKVQFAQTVLALEAFLVLFVTLVAYGLRTVDSVWPFFAPPGAGVIWAVGLVLMVVLLALSRSVGTRGGYRAGSIVQVPVMACGFAVPMMFLAGGIFVVLWVVALRLGGRIDTERAEYDAAHPETAPNVP